MATHEMIIILNFLNWALRAMIVPVFPFSNQEKTGNHKDMVGYGFKLCQAGCKIFEVHYFLRATWGFNSLPFSNFLKSYNYHEIMSN